MKELFFTQLGYEFLTNRIQKNGTVLFFNRGDKG
jgi:hypothetical protein